MQGIKINPDLIQMIKPHSEFSNLSILYLSNNMGEVTVMGKTSSLSLYINTFQGVPELIFYPIYDD